MLEFALFVLLEEVTREQMQRLALNAKNSHRAHDDAHATALLLRLLLRNAEVDARSHTQRMLAGHVGLKPFTEPVGSAHLGRS